MELLTKSIYANGECFADHSAEIVALRAENAALRAENVALKKQLSDIHRISGSTKHGPVAYDIGRRKPSRKRGVGGKGPKTEFMKKQLRIFARYLSGHGCKKDVITLYAHANQCWIDNKIKWDKAKGAIGQKKGYSCSKVLADAYKKSDL